MKKNYIVICCAFIFSACTHSSGNQNKKNTEDSVAYISPDPGNIKNADINRYYAAIENFYDSTLVRSGFNGAMLVAKKGQIIFEKYRGYFNFEKKDSLNEHSAFHLA
ncbi:MAG: hypothetical protein M3Z56_08330, partial [Bacteroidota bacterium]|nr:hypothetical protein [Bacteroidota bacterium]